MMRVLQLAITLTITLTLALVATSSAHAADPKAALRVDVAHARAQDASAFVNVSQIVGAAASAHAAARAQRAPIARMLARLGPSATLPMLELLALEPPKGVPAATAPLVRRDLIEALGLLADARALPTLAPILADASEDAESTRTTAEAIARIGTSQAEAHLLAALAAAGPASASASASANARARALVLGMGECRRIAVTEALAKQLASATDDETIRAATRALGRSGNAWAWKTRADRSEETRIRETAARALVDAFVRHEGSARDSASNALMVVDASTTPALIAAARTSATPATQAALDALALRFANNPAR